MYNVYEHTTFLLQYSIYRSLVLNDVYLNDGGKYSTFLMIFDLISISIHFNCVYDINMSVTEYIESDTRNRNNKITILNMIGFECEG